MSANSSTAISIWTEDAIVLFDWLATVDFDLVPAANPAVKQALADLLSKFEEALPLEDLDERRIRRAIEAVSADMGW